MNFQNLIQRTQEVVSLITLDILQNVVWQELQYNLDLCRANEGAHVEFRYSQKNCSKCLMLAFYFVLELIIV